MNAKNEIAEAAHYVRVKEMPNLYPFLTIPLLRKYIFKNERNIKECMLKIGGTLLIDTKKFNAWLKKNKFE